EQTVEANGFQHSKVKDMKRLLWKGYSQYAFAELINVRHSSTASLNQKIAAAKSLLCWYDHQQQFDKAYREIEWLDKIEPLKKDTIASTIPAIKVLKKLGKTHMAKRKIQDA